MGIKDKRAVKSQQISLRQSSKVKEQAGISRSKPQKDKTDLILD